MGPNGPYIAWSSVVCHQLHILYLTVFVGRPAGIFLLYTSRFYPYFIMFITKTEFYEFLYGTRIGLSKPPPFLKFRSSDGFIIATIALAVFTVRNCIIAIGLIT